MTPRSALVLLPMVLTLGACRSSASTTSASTTSAPTIAATTVTPTTVPAVATTTATPVTSPVTSAATTLPATTVAVTTTAVVPVELTELPRCAPEYPFGPPAPVPPGLDIDMAALEDALGQVFVDHPNLVGAAYFDEAAGQVVMAAIDTVNAERQVASIDLQGVPYRIEITPRTRSVLQGYGFRLMRDTVAAGVAGSFVVRRDGRTEITPDDERPATLRRIAELAGQRLGDQSSYLCIGPPR